MGTFLSAVVLYQYTAEQLLLGQYTAKKMKMKAHREDRWWQPF